MLAMILCSENLNPFVNLAAEEHLLTSTHFSCPILFLWRSENAVVIGKNQNPWLECNLEAMRDTKTALARRVSGGGAVYHDPGNLNVSLFVHRAEHDPRVLFDLILSTLHDLGINGHLADKNSLVTNKGKFSGSAFSLKPARALHHATLLVSSDLDRLQQVLQPSPLQIDSHAVRSKPAPVVNLSELNQDLTIDTLSHALSAAFTGKYPETHEIADLTDLSSEHLDELTARYESWDWRYGATPKFSARLGDAVFTVKDGKIIHPLPDGLPPELLDCRLQRSAIEQSIQAGSELLRQLDPLLVEP